METLVSTSLSLTASGKVTMLASRSLQVFEEKTQKCVFDKKYTCCLCLVFPAKYETNFQIDPVSGNLMVLTTLDREEIGNSSISLIIKVLTLRVWSFKSRSVCDKLGSRCDGRTAESSLTLQPLEQRKRPGWNLEELRIQFELVCERSSAGKCNVNIFLLPSYTTLTNAKTDGRITCGFH